MRVEKFHVSNILGIEELVVPTDGKHLILIGGENGQGKSSAIAAFCMAVCGKRGYSFPDIPLKEGTANGEIEICLTDLDPMAFPNTTKLTVRRYFDRGRGGAISDKLEILDDSGDPAPEPQAILNKLYEVKGLNPLDFDVMKKSDQRNKLLMAVGLHAELEKLETEHDTVFEERKTLGVKGGTAKAAAESISISMQGITHETTPVDVTALNQKLEAATDNAKALSALHGKQSSARSLRALAEKHNQSVAAELDKARKAVTSLEAAYVASLSEIDNLKIEEAEVDAQVANFEVIDPTEIARQLRVANDTNLAIEQAKRKQAHVDETESLRKQYDAKTARLRAIETEKTKLIMGANWPVPGVSVDSEGVLFNGIPIEQCSTAERIIVWTKVACALDPELKLIVIHNGNDLDNDSLKALDDLLQEHGFQALVEFVTRSSEDEQRCCVVLEDGRQKYVI